MSEQAKEAPAEGKKKKGKLPMIIVLAVVLGGGGFFGMKMKGGGKKEVPKIELGAIAEIKEEFLSNMAERNSYVRTKISLQLKKDYEAKGVEENLAAIQDVINMKLQSTSVKSVATLDGLRRFKRELAGDINKLLEEIEKKEHPEADKEASKDEKGDKEKSKEKNSEKKDEESPKHPDWDSQEGPVLKVLLVSFATQ